MMNAQLMATIYNAAGAKPALKPSDFIQSAESEADKGELTAQVLKGMLKQTA